MKLDVSTSVNLVVSALASTVARTLSWIEAVVFIAS